MSNQTSECARCTATFLPQPDGGFILTQSLYEKYGSRFYEIPPVEEVITLVPIGNPSKGTKFLNANYLITPQLTEVFDRISQTIDGFY